MDNRSFETITKRLKRGAAVGIVALALYSLIGEAEKKKNQMAGKPEVKKQKVAREYKRPERNIASVEPKKYKSPNPNFEPKNIEAPSASPNFVSQVTEEEEEEEEITNGSSRGFIGGASAPVSEAPEASDMGNNQDASPTPKRTVATEDDQIISNDFGKSSQAVLNDDGLKTDPTPAAPVDTTPAEVTIDVSPLINIANEVSYTFSGTCSENGRDVTYDIGGVVGTTTCSSGSWSVTLDTSSVADSSAVNITADHIDAAGNASTQALVSVIKDSLAPATPVLVSPIDTSILNNASQTITGSCEDGASVSISGDVSASSVVCASSSYSFAATLSAGDGVKNFVISQTDTANNPTASPLNASYTLDTTVPTVTIDALAVINLSNHTSYNFSGTCSEDTRNVDYSIAGTLTGSVACSTGTWSVTALDVSAIADNAAVTFLADHDDAGGNNAVQASQDVLKDTVRPTPLTLTTPADLSILNNVSQTMDGTCETSATVEINGAGISSGPYTGVCAAGAYSIAVTLTAGDGVKNFSIDQTDVAGNNMAATLDGSYTLDTTVPTVTIDTYPTINLSNHTSYAFDGTCSEVGRNVSYDLGGGAITGSVVCTGGNTWSVSALDVSVIADNAAVVILADHDDAGGNDAVQASQSVLKDTVRPTPLTLTTPADLSILNNVSQTMDGTCETSATVSITGTGLSGGPFNGACAAGAYSIAVTLTAGDGVKNFSIDQADVAGNNMAATLDGSYTLDTAIAVSITPNPGPINIANETSYVVSGTCSDIGTNNVVITVGGSVTDTIDCTAGGLFSTSIDVSALADNASVSVAADHTDAATNTANDTLNVLKDTVAPAVVVLTSPADDSSLDSVGPHTLTGTCEANSTITISSTSSELASASYIDTCTGGGTYSIAGVTLTAGDANKDFEIKQTDLAGNDSVNLDADYILDTVIPTVTIDSYPVINIANENLYTFSGSCSENGRNVSYDIGGGAVTGTAVCSALAWSATEDVSAIADNASVVILADHDDLAGNDATQASQSVLKDTVAPAEPTLVTVADGSYIFTSTAVTMTGACETGSTVEISGTGLVSTQTGACAASAYSINVTLTAGDGTKNFLIKQTDIAGNDSTSFAGSYEFSTAGPSIAITSSAVVNLANYTSYNVSGTCSPDQTGVIDVDIEGAAASGINCSGGTWSTTYDLTAIPDDTAMNIVANYETGPLATDAITVLKDTIRPTPLTIDNPVDTASVTTPNFSMSGTCETGATVEITGAGMDSGPYTDVCAAGAYSIPITLTAADGVKNWSVKQTDGAGNDSASPVTGSYTLTSFFLTDLTSTKPDGAYGLGETIDIVATFNQNITISGTPTVTLDTGDVVNMSSNTATTITFTYTVGAGDNSSDLAVTAMSPGTFIRNGASDDATITIPIAGGGNDLDEQKDILIDTTPPVFTASQFIINNGDTQTQNVFLSIAFQATDNVSNVTEFCFKYTDNTQPAAGDSCWKPLDGGDPGITPSNNVIVPETFFSVGYVPGPYTVYGFVKDGAGNISTHTSTDAQDQDGITTFYNNPPTVDGILVTDTATPADPPTSAELTIPMNTDVHIKWNVDDIEGLAASPVNLLYTTDGTNYTAVPGATGLDNASNSGCTIDEAGTTADDTMTGCFVWSSGSPTSGFFKIRLEVTDSYAANTTAYSVPLNDTSFNVLAGNTDRNIGNVATSAVFSHDTGTSADVSKQTFVVMPNGDIYIWDTEEGIVKISSATGLSEVFIPKGSDSNVTGAIASSEVRYVNIMSLDYDYNLWIFDFDRFKKIDFTAGTVTTMVGADGAGNPGTDPDPDNVLASSVEILDDENGASSHFIFFVTPDGKLYFTQTGGLYGTEDERFYYWNPADDKVYKIQITGIGSAGEPTYNPASHNCRLAGLYLSHDMNRTNTSFTEALLRADEYGGSCPGDPNWINLNPSTFVISAPHPTSNPDSYYYKYVTKGMDGKIYAIDHHSDSGLFKWNETTRDWDKILGAADNKRGSCKDENPPGTPTSALDCNVDAFDMFVSETGVVYFNDGGAIRTIDANGDVRTMYGQKLDYGDGELATAARFSLIRDFRVWDNAGTTTVTLTDPNMVRIREFPIGGAIETLLGTGTLGSNLLAGDDATERLEGMSEGTQFEVHPTTGDVFYHNAYDAALVWDRDGGVNGLWRKVYGNGATWGYSFSGNAGDGTPGSNIKWNDQYSPKPLAIDVTNRKVLYGENGYNTGTSKTNNSFLFTMDFDASWNSATYNYMLGLAGDDTRGSSGARMCAVNTSVGACRLNRAGAWDRGSDEGGFTAEYYARDNSWLMHDRTSERQRISKIKKDTNVLDFTTLDFPAVSFDYYDGGANEYIFYCAQNGNLYKRNVTTASETMLTIITPGITCDGLKLHYDPVRDTLIFIFVEGGMMGIGEYLNP